MQQVTESFDPNENLLERILSSNNMHLACKQVKANKGSAGVDNLSINTFVDMARANWNKIPESLFSVLGDS